MWVVTQGSVTCTSEPGSSIEVAPYLAASCQNVTRTRCLELQVLD